MTAQADRGACAAGVPGLRLGVACLVGALLSSAGCRDGAPRRDAADPSSIVVARPVAPPSAGLSTAPAAEPRTADEALARVEIALDDARLCVRAEGHVHCTTSPSADVALTSAPALGGIDDAVSLSLGGPFGCAATRSGKVLCFGDNTYGELGAQLRADRSDEPAVVTGVAGAKRVFTSASQACALVGDGTVRCWGRNDEGQTGGTTYYAPAARELVEADDVEEATEVVSVAVGGATTCAVTRARSVLCWGRAPFDAHRTMHTTHHVRPVVIPELTGLEDLSASGGTFCGVLRGEIKCWGELYALFPGEAGRGEALVSTGITGARRVRVAPTHACAVLGDGSVTCWGLGTYGALGRGETTGDDPLPPVRVRDVSSAIDVTVGGGASCALTAKHEIFCWGSWPRADGSDHVEPLPVRMRLD